MGPLEKRVVELRMYAQDAIVENEGIENIVNKEDLVWEKIIGPWSEEDEKSIFAFAIHPDNPNIIFVGSGTTGSGVYKTEDGGFTWQERNIGISKIGLFRKKYPPISKIVISPNNPDILYLGTAVDDLSNGGSGCIYRSDNDGELWVKVNGEENWLGNSQIQDIMAASKKKTCPLQTWVMI